MVYFDKCFEVYFFIFGIFKVGCVFVVLDFGVLVLCNEFILKDLGVLVFLIVDVRKRFFGFEVFILVMVIN